jgi:hypothetical protein
VRNFSTGGGGTTELSGTLTTSGSQTYNDAVVLIGETSPDQHGCRHGRRHRIPGDHRFNTTPRALAITTDGTATLGGAVGGVVGSGLGSPLASLTIDADAGIALNGGAVTTTGRQTYQDAVTLGAATTLTSTGSGTIELGGTVDGARTLAVNTGGLTIFRDASRRRAWRGADLARHRWRRNHPAPRRVGDDQRAQTYNDDVVLSADAMLTSTMGGAIAFAERSTGRSRWRSTPRRREPWVVWSAASSAAEPEPR